MLARRLNRQPQIHSDRNLNVDNVDTALLEAGLAGPTAACVSVDTLTVLRTQDGHRAAKTIRADADGLHVDNFDAGAKFAIETIPVDSVQSLGDAIAILSGDASRLVIRGQLGPCRSPSKQDGTVFRRKTVTGSAWRGYFDAAPRRWACIDSDHLPLPDALSQVIDPEAVVRHCLDILGDPWRTTTVFWQASSKAGLPGIAEIKLHLWFWLSDPVDDFRLRAELRRINKQAGVKAVDEALADSIQIHYTAIPIFDGIADPLPRRHGFLRGAVEEIPVDRIAPAPTQKAARVKAKKTVAVPVPVKAARKALPTPEAEGDVADTVRRLYPKTELYAAILDDILTLARLRHGGGGVGDGERDRFLFAAATAAANVRPGRCEEAAGELAAILVPGKDHCWVDDKLSSLQARADQHMRGERVQWQGREKSPIYSPSKGWFADFLMIADDEMEHLSKLVSEAVSRRRRRGLQPRAEWRRQVQADTSWQAVVAAELYYRRNSSAEDAARAMGISDRYFWSLLAIADCNTH